MSHTAIHQQASQIEAESLNRGILPLGRFQILPQLLASVLHTVRVVQQEFVVHDHFTTMPPKYKHPEKFKQECEVEYGIQIATVDAQTKLSSQPVLRHQCSTGGLLSTSFKNWLNVSRRLCCCAGSKHIGM